MSERLCNGLNEGSVTASMNRLTANQARNWAKKILILVKVELAGLAFGLNKNVFKTK